MLRKCPLMQSFSASGAGLGSRVGRSKGVGVGGVVLIRDLKVPRIAYLMFGRVHELIAVRAGRLHVADLVVLHLGYFVLNCSFEAVARHGTGTGGREEVIKVVDVENR